MSTPSPLSTAESKARRRRVPEDQRKRGVQSCDLCRKKRCKCIPAAGGGHQCANCLAQNAPCTYRLPRKTRIYGSVEDLSDRFRCLEALVRGAFPNDTLHSVQDLLELGQRKGYEMPSLSHEPGGSSNMSDILQTQGRSSSVEQQSEANNRVIGQIKQDETTQSLTESPGSSCPADDGSAETYPLIKDPSGREHYIGPSGGLQFLSQLRRLLISTEHDSERDEAPSAAEGSKFVEDDGALALETDDLNAEKADGNLEAPSISSGINHNSPGSVLTTASDVTKKSTAEIDKYWRQLPSPNIMGQLLHAYFSKVHDDFPLFHQATFEEDYEARLGRYQTRCRSTTIMPPQPVEDLDMGWLGCLHMMIALASMREPPISEGDSDNTKLVRYCVQSTKAMIPYFTSNCTLNHLRALVLLALFLHNNNERNATWNLIGTAIRMAFALGLHQDSTSSNFRPIERELRKRVFCTLYGVEQFLANNLGRPSGFVDSDIEISPPREDLLGGTGGTGDTRAQLVAQSVRLYQAMKKGVPPRSQAPSDIEAGIRAAQTVLNELEAWNSEVLRQKVLNIASVKSETELFNEPNNIPSMEFSHLRTVLEWQPVSKVRAMLLLRMQYHYIVLINTRPFLLHQLSERIPTGSDAPSGGSNQHDERAVRMADLCIRHSGQLGLLILLLDSFELINGVSGLDHFYIYWCCMCLCLAFLRAKRSLPEGDSSSPQALMDLVTQVHGAAMKVKQCGTMKRFTGLITDFMKYVQKPKGHSQHTVKSPGVEQQVETRPMINEDNVAQAGVYQTFNPINPNVYNTPAFYWPGGLIPMGDTMEGGRVVDTSIPTLGAWEGAFVDPRFPVVPPILDWEYEPSYHFMPHMNGRRW
ncbi:fungal-specific transcription factor domain-containing protein [Xylariaceae sp. FL1019]|nr:fungal-specific transcription factor domain-containing protein [Xylariaceae sp. FL1019]